MRTSPPTDPRVWLLLGDKSGDNAQLRILAAALGWGWEEKTLEFNSLYRVPNILLGSSRLSLRAWHGNLEAPWPDLILASGRRAVPVARWIHSQSGGRARLVHVGRPWAPLAWFDLVIAMPQYRVPAAPNVMHPTLPLNRLSEQRLAHDADAWRPRLRDLPAPYVAVLLGGRARPLRFGPSEAKTIAIAADEMARRMGGSVLAVTSRRTPPGLANAFETTLGTPHYVHEWRPNDADNPYAAFIALAERIVVSGDSASMLAEACRSGRKVIAMPLPYDRGARARLGRCIDAALSFGPLAALQRHGIAVGSRDMCGLLRGLAEAGHIALIDRDDCATAAPADDLPAIVTKIRDLMAKAAR